jgi:hypothetical protein
MNFWQLIILIVGYAAGIFGGGWAVGFLLRKLKSERTGQPRMGMLIGWFERFLAITFLLLDQGAAIGFIVAAKSILRFSETKEDKDFAEYVLLGTLISVSVAVLVSIMIGHLLIQCRSALQT